jgi:hypothetical protein
MEERLEGRVSRRKLILGAGGGAVAAWAAPAVLTGSSALAGKANRQCVTQAVYQGRYGVGCGVCVSQPRCGSRNSGCTCVLTVSGCCFCHNPTTCGPTCASNADCPSGWACAYTCCHRIVCVPPCGTLPVEKPTPDSSTVPV